MAQGLNAAKNGHHREYWGRRRFAGYSPCAEIKRLTHRIERRVDRPAAIAERLTDLE